MDNMCTQIIIITKAYSHFKAPHQWGHRHYLSIIPTRTTKSTTSTKILIKIFSLQHHLPPPPPPMNGYMLLDFSPRRAEREQGSSSVATPARKGATSTRRPRGGTIIDPNKRCSNNCNTSDTPMSRRGTLGPKVIYHQLSLLVKSNDIVTNSCTNWCGVNSLVELNISWPT